MILASTGGEGVEFYARGKSIRNTGTFHAMNGQEYSPETTAGVCCGIIAGPAAGPQAADFRTQEMPARDRMLGLTLFIFLFVDVSAFWQQQKNGNQVTKPTEYLGRYSSVGNIATELLRPIPHTSMIGMEQAAIDFSDGTNLRLSSQFEIKNNGRDALIMIGKLTARVRKTVETPMLQDPSGLEV
jgi:hypothetical protein